MKLSDIADVKTGLVLARKAADSKGSAIVIYKQLNLRCVQSSGEIDLNLVDTFLSVEELGSNYLTCPGDVIVRLTAPYTAVLITEETQKLVVPSHFCIIRTKGNMAVPEYIQWLLNSQIVKMQIAKNTTGTSYASIKPSIYSELEIEPIPIIDQKKIAQIFMIAQKELALIEELRCTKEQYYQTVLKTLYSKKRR